MKELWTRLENWLSQNCPKMLRVLNDGALENELANLRSLVDQDLPKDVLEFYAVHNGQNYEEDYLIDAEEFLSIERIHDEWNVWYGLLESKDFEENGIPIKSSPQRGIKDDWWNKYWIPFTYDGSGNHLCIDLDPGENGTYGQIIRMWHDSDERELIANSFTAWFENYVQMIENGQYVYSEEWAGLIHKDDLNEIDI